MDMQNTDLPFFDTPEDALKGAVQFLGGAKKVGQAIWPDKTIDYASRVLLDCLNPSRPEKLELTQIIKILSMAKEGGYHTAFEWFSLEVGYKATAITKTEEIDRVAYFIQYLENELPRAIATLKDHQKSKVRHI